MGETETGVTTMRMDAGLDTGDMLLSGRLAIPPDMTAGELYDALADEGAVLLSRTPAGDGGRTLRAVPQPAEGATYAPMLDRSLSPMDWRKPASVLHNQVRGLNPWPSATTVVAGRPHEGAPQPGRGWCRSGAGPDCEAESLYGILRGEHLLGAALEIQAEGSKRMPAPDYFRGHPVKLGGFPGLRFGRLSERTDEMNWIDYWYLILVVPALLVALFAQVKVQSTFKKYSQIGTRSGLSGAEASMNIQRQNGIRVPLEQVKGSMTDHYDPRANVIRLSETVYGVRSIAAIGVAAHETGHAPAV